MKLHFVMGRFLLTVICLSVMCMAISCEEGMPGPDEGDVTTNDNANVPTVAEAMRIEIPHLKDGTHNQFIVKTAKLRDNSSQTFVNYCVEYDQQKKSSRWTAFRWDIDNVYDSHCGRVGNYAPDTDVPLEYRVGSGAFRGYQRGHMLASEDRQCSSEANIQTFLMTNMHPQYGRFNGYDDKGDYVWLNAESLIRGLYSGWTQAYNSTDTIYVVKGGTIDSERDILGYTSNSNTDNIIVPGYFYMALLYKTGRSQTQGGYKAIALWIPHREGDTTKGSDIARKYAISIDELEQKTGIDFFCNLPDDIEDVVERNYSLAAWGWN
ncbi:MAG: DNA/RNA non-specific endonuclease [Paraprevotella sp.]|nr:DNA/RNA non-specific endonuclease [Paraprevotella sp.]